MSTNNESTPSTEIVVGKNKWGKILNDLKAEVSTWNKRGDTSWDALVRDTDTIKKNGDILQLIRNNTTYDIASLKSQLLNTVKEDKNVPTTKKEITVSAGDSISKILNNEFGSGKYKYGDKNGVGSMKNGWDKIIPGEKLTLETDETKKINDTYLYTLSRDKNEKKESITFVSSKLPLKTDSSPQTTSKQENTETTKPKTGALYFTDKKEWDALDEDSTKLKAIRLGIKIKNPQLDTSKWETTHSQNEWNVPGKNPLAPKVYRVDANGKAKEVNTDQ